MSSALGPVPVATGDTPPVAEVGRRSSRLPAIDGLRGVLMVVMTFNHLVLWPFRDLAFLRTFSFQPLGLVTAAEGFFFLSGLVAALAYGKLYDRGGLPAVWPSLLPRLAKIYLLDLAVTVAVVAAVVAGGTLPPEFAELEGEMHLHTVFALAVPFAFVNMPWLCDILTCYVLFLAVVPLLLRAVDRGYGRYVVLVSAGLWALAQFHPAAALARRLTAWDPDHHHITFGWFEVAGWQAIFVAAFLLGRAARTGRLPAWIARPPVWLIVACAAVAVAGWVQRHYDVPLSEAFLDRWADVQTLAPLRLLNFACLALLVRAAWPWLTPLLAWRPLAVLGEASLGVFVYHIVAVYLCAWFVPSGWFPVLILALVGMYPVALGWLAFRRYRKAAGYGW